MTAKFSSIEFARLQAVMGGKKPGTWAYERLIATIEAVPFERAILAEVLALRIILLNFHRAALAGQALTFEEAAAHVSAADRDKFAKAAALLAGVSRFFDGVV